MNKLDMIVADAVETLKGTGLRCAVVIWTPGIPRGVQSIAVGSNHADEAPDAFAYAVAACAQGDTPKQETGSVKP